MKVETQGDITTLINGCNELKIRKIPFEITKEFEFMEARDVWVYCLQEKLMKESNSELYVLTNDNNPIRAARDDFGKIISLAYYKDLTADRFLEFDTDIIFASHDWKYVPPIKVVQEDIESLYESI